MGNKNTRNNTDTTTRASKAPASTQPQVMDASPDNVAAKNVDSKASPETPTNGGPSVLPFRSYQTGTLYTNNFGPSKSSPKKVPHTKMRLSAQSPPFIPSNKTSLQATSMTTVGRLRSLIASQPHFDPYANLVVNDPYSNKTSTSLGGQSIVTSNGWGIDEGPHAPILAKRLGEAYTRFDRTKKDIIITYSSITLNLACLVEYRVPGEKPFFRPTREYHPDYYDFVERYDTMLDHQRIDLWARNWVEIIVDLIDFNSGPEDKDKTAEELASDLEKKKTGAVEIMNNLDDEFFGHAHTVFVTIVFPKEDSPRVGNQVKTCTKEQQESAAYQTIQNIANKLKQLSALSRLDIVLRTQAHTQPPVSLWQLNHALPFYELPFTKWQLKWQNTYMSRPETVAGWPITYLDIERNKINRQLMKAHREKELAIQNRTFVHRSTVPNVHNLPFNPRTEHKARVDDKYRVENEASVVEDKSRAKDKDRA